MTEKEPCAACETPVDTTLKKCPECGNNPVWERRKSGAVIAAVGLFLFLFPTHWLLWYAGIAGILIGVAVLIWSLKHVSPSELDVT